MSIEPGELNCLVDVQVPATGVDASNQPLAGFEPHPTYPKVWAKILSATGMSAVRASQEGLPVTPTKYSFGVRYNTEAFDAAMRLRYKGVTYDIRDVRHDHDGREWTYLVCETGGNVG